MPRIDLTTLIRDLALEPIPVAATVKIQARDAKGPYVSVDGSKVTFSRLRDIEIKPGELAQIDVPATDGSHFCWIKVIVGLESETRTVAVPNTTDVVPFGELVKVDPDTYEPTEENTAAWDAILDEVRNARDTAADARSDAQLSASSAADSAATATAAKDNAAASAVAAASAAGAADTAASSAGQAAGSAGAAAGAAGGSAGDAAASAAAALQSKNAAATSATDAGDSKTAAAASASAAGTSATAAAESATTASEAATTASGAATDATTAKNAAKTSATDADTRATAAASSATAAATSATNADTRATDAAASATAAGTASTAAETAKAGAETARTGAETAQTGAQTARTGAESAKTAAEAARDLALAGQFLGTAVASTGVDVNTLRTPGVYRFSGAAALASTNLPVAQAGWLEVHTTTGDASTKQEFHPFGSGAAARLGSWTRVAANSATAWDAWRYDAPPRLGFATGQPGVEYYTWRDTNGTEFRLNPTGIALGSSNLDTILLDGTYYQDNSANATTANNYPAVASNTAGILRVSRRNHDNWIAQEWNPLSFAATQQSITLIRRRINSTWQAWQIVPTSLTDSSVGRRQFLVDEVNGRLNMVYGDTGRRQFVTADMLNGVTGSWTLRRNGYTVTIEGNPAPQTDIPAGSAVAFGVVPAGFRPTMVNMRQPFRTSSSTVMQGIMIAGTTFEISLYAFQNYTVNQGPTPFSLTFQTADAWPTSLPGAALGVIPVN